MGAHGDDDLPLDSIRCIDDRGLFEAMFAPMSDGMLVDFAHVVLLETRAKLRKLKWKLESAASSKNLVVQGFNARKEEAAEDEGSLTALRGLINKAATHAVANMKLLFACGPRFVEVAPAFIGNVSDAAVPNPNKAALCNTFTLNEDLSKDIRFCFIGSHFPMQKLSAALQVQGDGITDAHRLFLAKQVMAQTLLRVLGKVHKNGLLDDSTIIFIAGDLNSRTVLVDGEAKDVMRDLFESGIIRAMADELGYPRGHFEDIAQGELPVTYKFCEQTTESTLSAEQLQLQAMLPESGETAEEHRSRLIRLGLHDNNDGKHFPACTDRVIYWVPDNLSERISWKCTPSFQVLYNAAGSDHRPVIVEGILQVGPRTTTPPKLSSTPAVGARDSVDQGILRRSLSTDEYNYFFEREPLGADIDTVALVDFD